MGLPKGRTNNREGRPKGSKNIAKKGAVIQMAESIIGAFKNGSYYVYRHTNNGQTVYIGKGKNNRAWDQYRQNDEHSTLMVNGYIEVRIVASDLSEGEALAIEAALIKVNKPKFNIIHAGIKNQQVIQFN